MLPPCCARGPGSLGTEDKLLPFLPLGPGVQTSSPFLLGGPEFSAPSPSFLDPGVGESPPWCTQETAPPSLDAGIRGQQKQSCGGGRNARGRPGEGGKGGAASCSRGPGRQGLKGSMGASEDRTGLLQAGQGAGVSVCQALGAHVLCFQPSTSACLCFQRAFSLPSSLHL